MDEDDLVGCVGCFIAVVWLIVVSLVIWGLYELVLLIQRS